MLLECYGDPADTDSYSEFHGFCVLPHEHDGEHQNIPFGEYHERRDASLPPLAQFEIIVVDDEQE
ncbi:hypothetical protein CZ674_07455 [Agrococcus casei LMG 22410]|uniref:Uncharacterized protein n=1 Tax=Agrococcus casei LMG 22410 TaxID=1255656 RepID=A0A1R4FYV2_9MICO|nr:hypothetical protein CZ674_07455 [Agrococcus casei LMG 22410]